MFGAINGFIPTPPTPPPGLGIAGYLFGLVLPFSSYFLQVGDEAVDDFFEVHAEEVVGEEFFVGEEESAVFFDEFVGEAHSGVEVAGCDSVEEDGVDVVVVVEFDEGLGEGVDDGDHAAVSSGDEIGRASCRERG